MKQLLCAICVLLVGLPVSGFAQDTITITTGEYPPYTSVKLHYLGAMSRIIKESFALAKIDVKFGFFPWARAMKLASAGKWDTSSGWLHTREREEHFFFSDPVVNIDIVFYHLKDFPFEWRTYDDLKDIKIGTTIGYSNGKMFDKAVQEGKLFVDPVRSDSLNFHKLLKGRIKIFPVDLNVGRSLLKKEFSPDESELITYHPQPVNSAPLYLLFSKHVKKNAHLVEIFNQGLRQLRESGKYASFLEESLKGEHHNGE